MVVFTFTVNLKFHLVEPESINLNSMIKLASAQQETGGDVDYDNDVTCTGRDPNTGLIADGCAVECNGSSGYVCASPVSCYLC